tara:strand:- start:1220 stop:1600 length:381 start_codon:yes stop_codon:yes gene_type:complete
MWHLNEFDKNDDPIKKPNECLIVKKILWNSINYRSVNYTDEFYMEPIVASPVGSLSETVNCPFPYAIGLCEDVSGLREFEVISPTAIYDIANSLPSGWLDGYSGIDEIFNDYVNLQDIRDIYNDIK